MKGFIEQMMYRMAGRWVFEIFGWPVLVIGGGFLLYEMYDLHFGAWKREKPKVTEVEKDESQRESMNG